MGTQGSWLIRGDASTLTSNSLRPSSVQAPVNLLLPGPDLTCPVFLCPVLPPLLTPHTSVQVPVNLLLVKNMTMHGIFWGSYLQRRPKVLLDGMAQVG